MALPSPARALRLHAVLLIGAASVVLAVMLSPWDWRWPVRAAIGWDIGVAVFLILSLLRLNRARSIDDIRRRAADLDQAGHAVLPLAILAAIASVVIVIGEAAGASRSEAAANTVLTLTTVALSWVFIHLIFAQHYAHEFYAPSATGTCDAGGLVFPGEDEPDYWDFVHFSLVIGVASQTADIQISSRPLRRLSTLHSVMAFVFNTVIVALAVNSALSLMG